MKRIFPGYLLIFSFLFISACSKKNTPQKSNSRAVVEYKADSTRAVQSSAPAAPVVKPTKTETIPNVITVNDAAARKSVDGRLYYDVNGNRYWKNFKDGKYYLFNKSMYENPDFKPPLH